MRGAAAGFGFILTPDQRLRVFVSSTLEELADERAAARRAIERLRLAPVWYESGARPHPPRAMYQAYVEQSQVFVGIYWQRYGWVAPGMEISGLEDEYRLASGKPMLLYLKHPAPDREPRLKAFIDGIRAAGTVSYRRFGTAKELERLLADDLAVLLSESFRGAMESVGAPGLMPDGAGGPDEASPGNLPLQVSSFIGRGQELERTAAALTEARLVTLTGVGGVGKTRLALQVAGEVRPRFRDGAWLCELAPIRNSGEVADAVAMGFSVTARAGESIRDALVEFLRNKELLLLLDNCEHLLDGVAALVVDLVRSCGQLAILATSRERLGVDGELLVSVPSLTVPDPDADLETMIDTEAVRLFVERAAAVKPNFALTPESAAAVAAVCRRLDGVALAIELAAARVPAMTPAELARRLDRRFAVLSGGRRAAVERHTTLRATIDWSFDLLTDAEQRLLCRLAVFAGGCTLEAVEAVCSGEGVDPEAVFELLASLVARSLVVAEERGPESRYRLLETIRQYGEERLADAGQAEPWCARHADYYAGFVGRIRERSQDDEVFWAVRLSAEQDNLLGAWSWAIETGEVDIAFRILAAFASSEIWNRYPLLLPGERALDLANAAEHAGYPLALAVSAVFAASRADAAAAEELCRRADESNAIRKTRDWRVEATVSAARQNVANTRGAFADAARFAEQAAGLARAGGDLADASVELTIAAADHVLIDDLPGAVPLATEALALARRVGSPALVASALLALGVAVADTDPDRSRGCLRDSLALSTALGYHSAIDLVWATAVASRIRDQKATLELGRRAILGLEWGGDRLRMGFVLHMIAGALATTRPASAAIIRGAAEANVLAPPSLNRPIALEDERLHELRRRAVEMDWDEAIAYTLTEAAQALDELESEK